MTDRILDIIFGTIEIGTAALCVYCGSYWWWLTTALEATR